MITKSQIDTYQAALSGENIAEVLEELEPWKGSVQGGGDGHCALELRLFCSGPLTLRLFERSTYKSVAGEPIEPVTEWIEVIEGGYLVETPPPAGCALRLPFLLKKGINRIVPHTSAPCKVTIDISP